MPKFRVPVPKMSQYTNDNLIIGPDMVDEDNMDFGVEAQFEANACIEDGCAGQKSIDTRFENFSEDIVDVPRSTLKEEPIKGQTPNHEGTNNPAPVCTDLHNYPHRRY